LRRSDLDPFFAFGMPQVVLGLLRRDLVTGDKDLLAMAGRYPVVTPAKFWEMHARL